VGLSFSKGSSFLKGEEGDFYKFGPLSLFKVPNHLLETPPFPNFHLHNYFSIILGPHLGQGVFNYPLRSCASQIKGLLP